jgi:hypothetical protein
VEIMAKVKKIFREELNLLVVSIDAQFNVSNAPTIHTIKLAEAMSKHLHKVYVVMRSNDNHSVTNNKVETIYVKIPKHSSLFIFNVYNLLVKNIKLYRTASKYASGSFAVYERYSLASFTGILISKRFGKKLYFEVNTLNVDQAIDEYHIKNRVIVRILKGLMRWQLKNATCLYVQTKELSNLINDNYGPFSTSIVPNGADINLNQTKAHSNNKILKLIYVGAIDSYHLVDRILDAFLHINNDAELLIIGSGTDLDDLKKTYFKENIKFLGEVSHDRVTRELAGADIGIAQYNLESDHFKKYGFYFCPLKMIEYASSKLPTIYIGKSNSFIREFDKAGACVIIESAQELRSIVRQFIDKQDKLEKMSQNAFKVAKSYTWDEAARKTLEAMDV